MEDGPDDLITLAQAAEYLKITRQSVLLAVRHQKLKPSKSGDLWYFKRSVLEEFKHKKFTREELRRKNGILVFNPQEGKFSVPQVAQMYGIKKNRVYHCIRHNMLNCSKVGGTHVIHIDDFDKWKVVLVDRQDLTSKRRID